MQHHPRTTRLSASTAASTAADAGGPDPDIAPVDASLAGTLLGGRYRLGDPIGAGAMGVVWTAWDQRLRRTVAIKQLIGSAADRHAEPGDLAPAKLTRARALREGRIAARVLHPRAIAVFDVVLPTGGFEAPWLVMEYLPSRSLAAVLREHGPLEPEQAAHVGAQIADALTAVHAAGIVHGDVKPGNVLIGAGGIAKITDFGVSRASWDTTSTGGGPAVGTPGYVAPEVARGEDPSAASDVFSLGATLYAAVEGELVCGPQPNPLAVLHAMAEGRLRPATRAGSLGRPLTAALRVGPENRPDMRGMQRALQARAASTPSPALDAVAPASAQVSAPVPAPVPAPAPGPNGGGEPVEPQPAEPQPAEPQPAEPQPPEPVAPAASEPVSDPDPPRGDRRPGGGGRVVLVAAAATVAIALGAGATVAGPSVVTRLTGDGDTARSTSQSVTPTAPAVSPAVPSVPSRGTSSTAEAAPGAPVTDDDVSRTVADYYSMLPTDLSSAWSALSDGARAESGGFDSYRQFWQTIQSVSADDVRVDGDTAAATITFLTVDGRTSRETYRFEVGRSGDGHLQIQSARRSSSSE